MYSDGERQSGERRGWCAQAWLRVVCCLVCWNRRHRRLPRRLFHSLLTIVTHCTDGDV